MLGGDIAGLPFDQSGDLEVCEVVFGQVTDLEPAFAGEDTPEMQVGAVVRKREGWERWALDFGDALDELSGEGGGIV